MASFATLTIFPGFSGFSGFRGLTVCVVQDRFRMTCGASFEKRNPWSAYAALHRAPDSVWSKRPMAPDQ